MSAAEIQPDTDHWQSHRAARLVASNARSAEELGELLAMLGLTAAEGRYPPEPAGPSAEDDQQPAPRPPHAVVAEQRRRLASTLFAAFTAPR